MFPPTRLWQNANLPFVLFLEMKLVILFYIITELVKSPSYKKQPLLCFCRVEEQNLFHVSFNLQFKILNKNQ